MYKVGRSRTPQGVRGLKHRGANTVNSRKSRTPQGVRGLKPKMRLTPTQEAGRTPQGVRGLKLFFGQLFLSVRGSHSARSAWIETMLETVKVNNTVVALRKECVD